jgi:hypothetical protein
MRTKRKKDVRSRLRPRHHQIHLLLLSSVSTIVEKDHAGKSGLRLALENDVEGEIASGNDVDPLLLMLDHARQVLYFAAELLDDLLESFPPVRLPDGDERCLPERPSSAFAGGVGDDGNAGPRTDVTDEEHKSVLDDSGLEGGRARSGNRENEHKVERGERTGSAEDARGGEVQTGRWCEGAGGRRIAAHGVTGDVGGGERSESIGQLVLLVNNGAGRHRRRGRPGVSAEAARGELRLGGARVALDASSRSGLTGGEGSDGRVGDEKPFDLGSPDVQTRSLSEEHHELRDGVVVHGDGEGEIVAVRSIDDPRDVAEVDATLEADLVVVVAVDAVGELAETLALVVGHAKDCFVEELPGERLEGKFEGERKGRKTYVNRKLSRRRVLTDLDVVVELEAAEFRRVMSLPVCHPSLQVVDDGSKLRRLVAGVHRGRRAGASERVDRGGTGTDRGGGRSTGEGELGGARGHVAGRVEERRAVDVREIEW